MTKLKKISFVFAAYFLLLVIDGCGDGFNCNCGDTLPFFDFKKISVSPVNTEVAENQSLKMILAPDDIDFLSQVNHGFNLGLIGTAYGCSCIGDGGEGLKYDITDINVFSNQDFNNTITAGTSLNSIIKVERRDNAGLAVYTPLEDETTFEELQHLYTPEFILVIDQRPDSLNVEHVITVEITKSNGEKSTGTSDPISWQ